MTVTLHKDILPADMHGIVGKYGPFATAALRRAQALNAGDVGQIVRQTDTDPASFWIVLKVVSGVGTWSRIDTGAEAVGPLGIMAGHVRFGYSGDVGLSTTAWTDQGPNARHLAGTCAVAAAALGGKNCMQTNGTTHLMQATFATPAPGTTPTYLWVIARNDSGGGFGVLVSLKNDNGFALIRDTGADELCIVSPGFGLRHATGFTVGSFKRVRALFSNSSSDLVQVGSAAAVTAAPASNNAGVGLYLGASNGTFSASTLAEVWGFDQDPGGTLLAQLDAWATGKYSASFP